MGYLYSGCYQVEEHEEEGWAVAYLDKEDDKHEENVPREQEG